MFRYGSVRFHIELYYNNCACLFAFLHACVEQAWFQASMVLSWTVTVCDGSCKHSTAALSVRLHLLWCFLVEKTSFSAVCHRNRSNHSGRLYTIRIAFLTGPRPCCRLISRCSIAICKNVQGAFTSYSICLPYSVAKCVT